MENSQEERRPGTETEEATKKPKLLCSVRLMLSLMLSLAVFDVSYVRIGISIALVCMARGQSGSADRPGTAAKVGEFNWSSATKGYLTSAAFYGFILGPSAAGFLSFKYGGKIVLIIGVAACGASNILVPEGTRLSTILFFAIRVVSGFFAGFVFPAFYDLVSHWILSEERQLLVGGALIGIPLASILNFPINTLICDLWGWVWIFYLLGIWMIACGVAFAFTVYNYPDKCPYISAEESAYLRNNIPRSESADIPWKKIIASMPIYAYVAMHFCMNYVYLSMILSLPLIMEEVYELPLKENGMLSATPYMGSLFVRIMISLFFESLREKLKLSKNAMRKILISTGATLFSSFMFVLTFLSRSYRYWALGCLIMAASGLELCITGGYLLSLLDLCPSYVNVITGIANSIGNTAGLICPVVNGLITVHGTKEEWNVVFYSTVSVLLTATIFYMVFGQNHLQHWGLATLPQPPLPRASLVN